MREFLRKRKEVKFACFNKIQWWDGCHMHLHEFRIWRRVMEFPSQLHEHYKEHVELMKYEDFNYFLLKCRVKIKFGPFERV
jgi:hypothetical protein